VFGRQGREVGAVAQRLEQPARHVGIGQLDMAQAHGFGRCQPVPCVVVHRDHVAGRDFYFAQQLFGHQLDRLLVAHDAFDECRSLGIVQRRVGQQGFVVRVILEQFVEGDDLRLVVIGYEVVAAAVRKPPFVIGTGRDTVEQLMEKYNLRRMAATGGESKLALRNELDDASVYAAIARSERVAGLMTQLLGDEVYHYHHKMMLKEPRVGGAWEWHQDYGYWYEYGCLYPDMGSCLISVDRATRENGCLQVLRGSQKLGRINHTAIGDQIGADPLRVNEAMNRHELFYCELEPGDAIFFHGNLLHRSDRNRSDNPRWSLICCYNTRHNDPYIEDSRHAHYAPLQIQPDESVLQVGQAQCQALMQDAQH